MTERDTCKAKRIPVAEYSMDTAAKKNVRQVPYFVEDQYLSLLGEVLLLYLRSADLFQLVVQVVMVYAEIFQ